MLDTGAPQDTPATTLAVPGTGVEWCGLSMVSVQVIVVAGTSADTPARMIGDAVRAAEGPGVAVSACSLKLTVVTSLPTVAAFADP
jgi:hypothetical protein